MKIKLGLLQLICGLVAMLASVIIALFGSFGDNDHIYYIAFALLIFGIILYRSSSESRISLEKMLRQTFPEIYRYISVIIIMIVLVVIIIIIIPLKVALLFSGIVILSGVLSILTGRYINKRRSKIS